MTQHIMKQLSRILSILVLAISLSSAVYAQSADITGNAEVLAAINVTGATNLDFGSVEQGTNKTVNADGSSNDADVIVGEFTVGGSDGASVTLDFTQLSDLSDGGGNTLTIAYNSTNYALWSTDADNTTTGDNTAFDPTTATPSATLDADGISVFIGGEAQPGASQVAGTYSGTITLSASYN